LASRGAFIYLVDLDQENGLKVIAEIGKEKAGFVSCDLADHEAIGRLFGLVKSNEGRLDILVNNAGIAHIGNAEKTLESDIDRMYRVNVKSAYSCLHFGIPLMKESGGGAIVNMSSVAAFCGVADRFAYSMTKGAIQAMTLSVAKDYIADNIRCNSVGPGRVHTPFVDGFLHSNYPGQEEEMFEKLSKTQPIGRMGKPDEIAQLVAYLCSEAAGFITGSFYPIDGGFLTLNS
jgi:NAD(P)-dependent dehydrogenase (short-subunit alcohol dehydrogenase family)